MSKLEVPLTAWDLREIAKTLDSVVRKLGDAEGGRTAFGDQFDQVKMEVCRPGSDTGETVGVITYYDGWLGFYPSGSVEAV